MTTTEIGTTIHGLDSPVSTEGFDPGVLATTASDRKSLNEKWNAIVDQPLIDWGLNPSFEDEDGLVSPSREAIATAATLVRHLRWQKQNAPLPTDVIVDGEGGIVFENRHDPLYQRFEIDEQGHIVLLTFLDCVLYSQQIIEIKANTV